ncbi:hypothetical protein ACO2Q3_17455 [Caulobacter sp. KR2-114]|uniref:hypothetical protein n=1 Tax=Caulobacter sp. KR2-114 TaxID=3400912 RepID=UPI003C112BA0
MSSGVELRLTCCLAAAVAALCLPAAPATAAPFTTVRMFAYDPGNDETRRVAGPLTFEFRQQMVFTTLLKIRATEAQATAVVTPADERALGPGGLTALIGANAPERDLFAIQDEAEGPAMISAFCPGSKHAWVAIGRIRANRDLKVHIIGDGPAPGQAHVCHSLQFYFHGEWKTEVPFEVNPAEVKKPHFPY